MFKVKSFLAVFLVLAFAACGGKKSNEKKSTETAKASEANQITVYVEVDAEITGDLIKVLDSAKESDKNDKITDCHVELHPSKKGVKFAVENDVLKIHDMDLKEKHSLTRVSGENGSVFGEWKAEPIKDSNFSIQMSVVIKPDRLGLKNVCSVKD